MPRKPVAEGLSREEFVARLKDEGVMNERNHVDLAEAQRLVRKLRSETSGFRDVNQVSQTIDDLYEVLCGED